ncbi:MAG: hypothetical protein AAB433_17960 [Nitrospirota bacterium]
MIDILQKAWETVENFYKNGHINSERCLQAVLYHALRTSSLPEKDMILVEPKLGENIPDIVICDDDQVKCILELKCSPHSAVQKVPADLDKLIHYASKKGPRISLHTFGPDRVFNMKTKTWFGGKTDFLLTQETWYVFAVLARHDDNAASLKGILKWRPSIGRLSRFCLLAGAMNPEASEKEDRCRFSISPIGELPR